MIIVIGYSIIINIERLSYQPEKIILHDIVVATSTKAVNVKAKPVTVKAATTTASLTKKKFDPYAPVLKTYPGINGPETVDLTRVKYPECAAPKTRAGHHPEQIDLVSKIGLIVQEDKDYYDIDGTNEFYISYEVYNCTIPLQGLDGGVDAVTESNLNYNFTYDPTGGQVCNISNVAVGVHVSYLLPRWIYAPVATGKLLDIWNTYSTAIEKHEEHHGSIAKEYGNKLYSYISGLSASRACVSSLGVIETKYNDIINDLNAAQAKYDLDVDHGKKEGVFSFLDDI